MNYKDLNIYKNSYTTSLIIHKLTLKFPKIELYELGDQLRRSTKSIPANIAEGYGKKHYKKEWIKFLYIALGSCDETIVHLDYAKDLEYINIIQHKDLIGEYTITGKQIRSLINKISSDI